MAEQSISQRPVVVLVTGSGRSGTSSVAGSLKRLGLHVPQPEVPAKPSNERGFYEPQWVIDFHKRYLKELGLFNIDSRPRAVAMVAERLQDGSAEQELKAWLSEQVQQQSRIVVKDPHAFWFADVWKSAADDVAADLRVLMTVRHPAEVVGSRDLAYLQKQPAELRRIKETSNVAGWVHSALLTEVAGRGRSRAFVRYADLIGDWRSTLGRVGEQLDLTYDGDLTPGQHHELDDFIDTGLRHSQLTWDDVSVPAALQAMAEEVWQLLGRMVDEPGLEAASARLDEIHAAYDEMYEQAVATVYDHSHGELVVAQRENVAEIARLKRALKQQRKQNAELREQLSTEASPQTNAVRRLVRRVRPS
jgi:hypothetical protein